MPRPLRPLDPSRSAAHWLGAEIRHWRTLRGLTQHQLGALVHISGDLVSKMEKAERPCRPSHAAALDAALETGGVLSRCAALAEAEMDNRSAETDNQPNGGSDAPSSASGAGTLRGRSSILEGNELSPVERRNFLAGAGTAALAAGQLLQLINPASAAATPKSVRPGDIEQIRTAASTLRTWDNLYGSAGVVRETAVAQLRWAATLLDSPCPTQLRNGLFTAVGRLSTVVGAAAFDAFVHEDAEHLLTFATSCAEEADNWALRAISYNLRARQAIWRGDPDTGLTLAELGLARADRLSPAEQSMLHNARARAFAKMGRTQETLAAIGRSDDSFASSSRAEENPWMAYYDNAQHHGDTGHALYDLALAGHSPREAIHRLESAVNGHSDSFPRSRAFSRTKLASLRMATGDPNQAAVEGRTALTEVSGLRSQRADHELADLARLAHRHRAMADVRDLREQIAATVAR